eukprot:TRINITY_DN55994_c0_g1_i1.p2 TRINITY_DN55994_c0_g1~~TRINITY_DN55994_c0_g1_i1.p2  ORF type:complete len:142 (-),score=13.31 TRINITY_DN55994_c0_g1_i1:70-495(-)
MFSNLGSDNQRIGVGLCMLGILSVTLGVLLFFDSVLLSIGDLLFLSGIPLIVGVNKTKNLFFQRSRWKGSVTFFTGVTLVLCRWAFLGFVVQVFGFVNLFGDFFPLLLRFARTMPGLGTLLTMWPMSVAVDRICNAGRSQV